jgi:DNA-binding transcriptional regulator YhcF (GntR family)
VISQKLREQRSTDSDALLAQALKNFAAVLLRLGINARRAESLLRTAFIDAAETYARSQGARVNQSLIATLAGINRVDVRKALRARAKKEVVPASQLTRLDRVLAAWQRDARFCDRRGSPRPLSYKGESSEFSRLVRKYGRDVTTKSVLAQLLRAGLVAEKAGRLVFTRNGDAKSSEANAARADLRFLVAQLKELRLRLGRRAYVTRTISVRASDRRMAQRLQRITVERIHLMLSALDSMSFEGKPKSGAPTHRVIISATVATETGRDSDETVA